MTVRVLSIDGGGMRGIYVAAYLDSLERSFVQRPGASAGLDIGKAFRLIVGTSTGAIVGCGLAKGVPPKDIVRLYREHGSMVFRKRLPSSVGVDLATQLVRRPKYLENGTNALRAALNEVFGEATIGSIWLDRQIALAVPAVNMANYRPWIFKTPHDPKSNHRDDAYSLTDVCLASSAAPLFRSLAIVRNPVDNRSDVFADGGLWANNPVLVALCEALRLLGDDDPDEAVEIFALGSCGKPEGEVIAEDAIHRGLLQWKFGGEAAKVAVAAQEFAFDMVAKFLRPYLKRHVRIIRFPAEKIPGAMLQYLDLDETRPVGLDALEQHARKDADMTNSAIQEGKDDGRAIEDLFDSMPERPS